VHWPKENNNTKIIIKGKETHGEHGTPRHCKEKKKSREENYFTAKEGT
jgi:hypothetical protein